jgi:hypothetical protein
VDFDVVQGHQVCSEKVLFVHYGFEVWVNNWGGRGSDFCFFFQFQVEMVGMLDIVTMDLEAD